MQLIASCCEPHFETSIVIRNDEMIQLKSGVTGFQEVAKYEQY